MRGLQMAKIDFSNSNSFFSTDALNLTSGMFGGVEGFEDLGAKLGVGDDGL